RVGSLLILVEEDALFCSAAAAFQAKAAKTEGAEPKKEAPIALQLCLLGIGTVLRLFSRMCKNGEAMNPAPALVFLEGKVVETEVQTEDPIQDIPSSSIPCESDEQGLGKNIQDIIEGGGIDEEVPVNVETASQVSLKPIEVTQGVSTEVGMDDPASPVAAVQSQGPLGEETSSDPEGIEALNPLSPVPKKIVSPKLKPPNMNQGSSSSKKKKKR
ncbi:hypothetical protein U1Q18_014540, partial [Sarracenia purpurea var. burkii]